MAESIKENINRNERQSKNQSVSRNGHKSISQTRKIKLVLNMIWAGLKSFNSRIGNKTTLITLNKRTTIES